MSAVLPDAAKVLPFFYADDFLSGASSTEEAIELCSQMQQLLHKGGFTIRK